MPKTCFEKIWENHVIANLAPNVDLLNVDWHFVTDVRSRAFKSIEDRGLPVRNPERTIGIIDHVVSSEPGRTGGWAEWSDMHIQNMREGCAKHGLRLFDVNDAGQGIAHVVAPQLGIAQPGTLILCADSHTSTLGGLGALAWGIGFSEVIHVLATQTIVQRKPKTMRIRFDGRLEGHVEAKDVALYMIGRFGTAGGMGYAVEFAGPVIDTMSVEQRMTICNLAVEFGAKVGLVSPDEKTVAYLAGRSYAPVDTDLGEAATSWLALRSDDDAIYDADLALPVSELKPQITWGTSPEDTIAIDGVVPYPDEADTSAKQAAWQASLDYMGLTPGAPIVGTPVDRVFIGSCTNARLSDLEAVAELVKGRKVASRVEAWVVPGSQQVKRDAERAGLDRIFIEAGFQWREPSCSLCAGANGELVPKGQRCVSTSNRNFVGRQGPGARTHLSSPATAAAAALAGMIADVRSF